MNKRYDFVFMDIQMPELDGFETLSILQSKGFDRPIIALSAHVLKHQVEECLEKGFTTFLPKPLTISKLTKTLIDMQTLQQNI